MLQFLLSLNDAKILLWENVKLNSKIAEYLKMTSEPVAVIMSDECPNDAIEFQKGKWGCVVSLIVAASNGKIATVSDETVVCKGGRAGTGIEPFQLGSIEYYLSTGGKDSREPERFKKNPELAKKYVKSLPEISKSKYLIFKPLKLTGNEEKIAAVIFLVNADQLSALVTLANYDQENDMVRIPFGAGCVQTLLFPIKDFEKKTNICTVGLTEPSVRRRINKDILSFTIPYNRFLEMENESDESFLSGTVWSEISSRII